MKRWRKDSSFFWSKVATGDDAECWEWQGYREPRWGYGRCGGGGRSSGGDEVAAHRIAWILARGEIPDGLCVLHRCDNPPCVNPAHLFLGTKADNNADKAQKDRSTFGSLCPTAKLTEDRVTEVLRRYEAGESQTQVARAVGVSRSAVRSLLIQRTWRRASAGSASATPPRWERCRKKLTPDQALEIRRRVEAGELQANVGRDFGVSQSMVSGIVRGRSWREAIGA